MEVLLRTISEFSHISPRANPWGSKTREPSHVDADPASYRFGRSVPYERDPPHCSSPWRLRGHGGDGSQMRFRDQKQVKEANDCGGFAGRPDAALLSPVRYCGRCGDGYCRPPRQVNGTFIDHLFGRKFLNLPSGDLPPRPPTPPPQP